VDSGGSGTLTISDGTHVAILALIGTYTAGSFKTADDGHGGTLLTDPPISGSVGIAAPH
jgi:hypothetical protein